MLLAKTDRGRAAIQNRDAGLSAQDRHILIISNGQRSLNDVVAMLGPATLAPIDRLLREGFLCTRADNVPVVAPVETAISGMGALLRASRELASKVQDRAQAVIVAASTAPSTPQDSPTLVQQLAVMPAPSAPAPRPGVRRSMAAAKMYMLDMLQLQRSVEAATLKVSIQSSNGAEDTVAALIEALRHLQRVATPSYYARVSTRLNEVVPEEFVPRLSAAIRLIAAGTTAAA